MFLVGNDRPKHCHSPNLWQLRPRMTTDPSEVCYNEVEVYL